jgi:hypothetical protein
MLIDFTKEEYALYREKELQESQSGFFGCCKIGRPIYVFRIGSVNADRLLKAIDNGVRDPADEIKRAWSYLFESSLKLRYYACSDLYDR